MTVDPPSGMAARAAAAVLLLLPPFLFMLLAVVIPPTKDTFWRKFDVSDNVGGGYYTQGFFTYKAVLDTQSDTEGSLLGDGEDDLCGDTIKADLGDECCESFMATQALGVTSVVLLAAALAILLGGIMSNANIPRAYFFFPGALAFSAGILAISLVIVFDSDMDSPLCGHKYEPVAGNEMFRDLEYGPLFYLSIAGGVVSLLSGTVLCVTRDTSSRGFLSVATQEQIGSHVDEHHFETQSNIYPGSLLF